MALLLLGDILVPRIFNPIVQWLATLRRSVRGLRRFCEASLTVPTISRTLLITHKQALPFRGHFLSFLFLLLQCMAVLIGALGALFAGFVPPGRIVPPWSGLLQADLPGLLCFAAYIRSRIRQLLGQAVQFLLLFAQYRQRSFDFGRIAPGWVLLYQRLDFLLINVVSYVGRMANQRSERAAQNVYPRSCAIPDS